MIKLQKYIIPFLKQIQKQLKRILTLKMFFKFSVSFCGLVVIFNYLFPPRLLPLELEPVPSQSPFPDPPPFIEPLMLPVPSCGDRCRCELQRRGAHSRNRSR